MKQGLVLKSTGSWYLVEDASGKIYRCRIKGKLRTMGIDTTNPVAVGDKVNFEPASDEGEGMIAEVQERENYIIRKSVNLSKQAHIIAANLDLALVVATPAFPRTSTGFIDRFLATAEAYRIPAGVIFNKSDLWDEAMHSFVKELEGVYKAIGYTTFSLSAIEPESLLDLQKFIQGKVTLFSGHSGTGKSTLINQLIPGKELKTAPISAQHLKGKHTTTFGEMHPLPFGGYLVDTPGIREFGTLDFEKQEVSHFFPEIFQAASGCKFNNCLHLNESNCAVLDAVNNQTIALSRYQSYLSILSNEDIFK